MKHLILLSSLFILGALKIFSQSDFREGYIVKYNNDTIYGLIDYKGNLSNSKMCIFKTGINSEKKEYTPVDIESFRFTDSKSYVSKTVKSNNQDHLVFLEYLINGIVDIYYYRDGSGDNYFVDIGGSLYKLKNEEKKVIIDDKVYYKDSKEFIGVLKVAFQESPTISKKAENIRLNQKSLIKIANDYHTEVCSDEECIIYGKRTPAKPARFGILLGSNNFSISEIAYIPINRYYIRNMKVEPNIIPSIGLYYKKQMHYINENLFFQYELTYSYMKIKALSSFIEPDYSMTYKNKISLNQNALNNSLLFKYILPSKKIKPAFQAGGFVNYYFDSDYTRNLEVVYSWGETYYTDENTESPFTNIDLGVSLGFSVIATTSKEKEIFIDLRYQRGFGLMQSLHTNIYSLNIGFQIR